MSKEKTPAGVITAQFNKTNPNWARTSVSNVAFLAAQQNWAEQLLIARGFLTLNEVFDMLGLPQTEEGALTGWVGDINVSFGEEATAPVPGAPITLVFNTNSTNVFHDMK